MIFVRITMVSRMGLTPCTSATKRPETFRSGPSILTRMFWVTSSRTARLSNPPNKVGSFLQKLLNITLHKKGCQLLAQVNANQYIQFRTDRFNTPKALKPVIQFLHCPSKLKTRDVYESLLWIPPNPDQLADWLCYICMRDLLPKKACVAK